MKIGIAKMIKLYIANIIPIANIISKVRIIRAYTIQLGMNLMRTTNKKHKMRETNKHPIIILE
jgi:hypothetical protein